MRTCCIPSQTAVPVLVLGSGLTATGVVRTLGRAGIPLFCIGSPKGILGSSRWYRALPEAVRTPTADELPEFLAGLSLSRAVLMPCSDDWVTATSCLPDSLRDRFPASMPTPCVTAKLVEKWRFAEMLQGEGLPHPRTMLLESLEQMEAMPDACYDRMFLKPRCSQEFSRLHKVKAFLIKDKADALAIMSRVYRNGAGGFPIMLQEYIPGPPTNHYFIDGFVDRRGRICALFARRRLRMFPPWLGNSTLMKSVALADVQGAVRTIEQMWSAHEYRGIFSTEFKYDDRDGLFKILEVNARPWWYIEFAARCGVDVCGLAYRDALGMPVEALHTYSVGERCVYLPRDFGAYRDSRALSLTAWVRSWMGAQEAVFCWDDPLPALLHWSRLIATSIREKL